MDTVTWVLNQDSQDLED